MLLRHRAVALAGLIVLLAALACPAAAQDDPYTVGAVHVDVTAANGTAARDKAMAEGQARAFDMLMTKLGAKKPSRLGAAAMNELVTGFEVANEHVSGVRYVADYTFHFRPDAVRKLIQGTDTAAAPTEPAAKPLLVLPVFNGGERAVLWEDPNPWRNAWSARAGVPSGQPIIVPGGELADVQAIDAAAAVRGEAAAIQAISSRYQNDDVLVVVGAFSGNPRRIDVTAARYVPGGSAPPQTIVFSVSANPGEGDGEMMRRAINGTLRQVQIAARNAAPADAGAVAAPDTSGTATLTGHIMSSSLADWVALREKLKTIAGVRSAELVSADRDRMQVAIRYVGEESKLRAALHERDIDVTGSGPDWTLQRRIAPAFPSAPTDAAASGGEAPKLDALRKPDERP